MRQDYELSSDKSLMDINAIHCYLSRSYWAENVPYDIVKKAINNSLCFGVFYKKSQIGFARLITDSATFAYLADVYILEEHRGKGLSKKLMATIINHPQLQGLRRMVLATHDAHTLYEKFGFKQLTKPETFMELWQPDIYKEKSKMEMNS
ncbi:GNAT family N-acetyltransferase [Colwelliaceae bacterium MEBiC 14330]